MAPFIFNDLLFQLNTTVRRLDLSHNNISTEGSKKLGRVLGMYEFKTIYCIIFF